MQNSDFKKYFDDTEQTSQTTCHESKDDNMTSFKAEHSLDYYSALDAAQFMHDLSFILLNKQTSVEQHIVSSRILEEHVSGVPKRLVSQRLTLLCFARQLNARC